VMVFNETRALRDVLKRLGKFFAHESCGKCYPCQMGTQRQMEILDRVAAGHVVGGDFTRLQDVGWTMTDASLCGLGQTAASAVMSAMKLWPELFVEDQRLKVESQKVSNASKVSKTARKPVVKKAATKKVSKVSKVSKAKPKAVKKVVKATAKKKSKKTTTRKK
jgi:hypothetical protein